MSFFTKDDKAEMKVNGCISGLNDAHSGAIYTMKIALQSSKLWNEFQPLVTLNRIKQSCGIGFYSVYCGDVGSDVDV